MTKGLQSLSFIIGHTLFYYERMVMVLALGVLALVCIWWWHSDWANDHMFIMFIIKNFSPVTSTSFTTKTGTFLIIVSMKINKRVLLEIPVRNKGS